MPGAGDRIVPNAKDIVEAYFHEYGEINDGNYTMENIDTDEVNNYGTSEKYVNNNQTIDIIEDEKNTDKFNNMQLTSPIMPRRDHLPHRRRRTPTIIIQSLWRGAIIRKKVTKALSYEQLKKRATLRRFSKHRMEIERAKAKNRRRL